MHDKGGQIFIQIVHAERMSHADDTPHHLHCGLVSGKVDDERQGDMEGSQSAGTDLSDGDVVQGALIRRDRERFPTPIQ